MKNIFNGSRGIWTHDLHAWAELLQGFRGLIPPKNNQISIISNRKPTHNKFQ